MKLFKGTIPRYRMIAEPTAIYKVKIERSADADEYARQFYKDDLEVFESMFMITLNRANNSTGYVKISQGGIAGTLADIKLICKHAIDALASGVIIIHNHPSGNVRPSVQDDKLTQKIKDALQICDIKLIDHMILTPDSYWSYADEDKII